MFTQMVASMFRGGSTEPDYEDCLDKTAEAEPLSHRFGPSPSPRLLGPPNPSPRLLAPPPPPAAKHGILSPRNTEFKKVAEKVETDARKSSWGLPGMRAKHGDGTEAKTTKAAAAPSDGLVLAPPRRKTIAAPAPAPAAPAAAAPAPAPAAPTLAVTTRESLNIDVVDIDVVSPPPAAPAPAVTTRESLNIDVVDIDVVSPPPAAPALALTTRESLNIDVVDIDVVSPPPAVAAAGPAVRAPQAAEKVDVPPPHISFKVNKAPAAAPAVAFAHAAAQPAKHAAPAPRAADKENGAAADVAMPPVARKRTKAEQRERRRTTGDTDGMEKLVRVRIGDVQVPLAPASAPADAKAAVEVAQLKQKVATLEAEATVARAAALAQPRAADGAAPDEKPQTFAELEEALVAAVTAMGAAFCIDLAPDVCAAHEATVEALSSRVTKHPERKLRDERQRRAWVDAETAPGGAATLALKRLRGVVPVDVASCGEAGLVAAGLRPELAKRVARTRALWLVRTHPEDLARRHAADLTQQCSTQGLDVVEARAVWNVARLAPFPSHDADGKKRKWFDELERRVRELAQSDAAKILKPKDRRHAAYDDSEAPLFDDCDALQSRQAAAVVCGAYDATPQPGARARAADEAAAAPQQEQPQRNALLSALSSRHRGPDAPEATPPADARSSLFAAIAARQRGDDKDPALSTPEAPGDVPKRTFGGKTARGGGGRSQSCRPAVVAQGMSRPAFRDDNETHVAFGATTHSPGVAAFPRGNASSFMTPGATRSSQRKTATASAIGRLTSLTMACEEAEVAPAALRGAPPMPGSAQLSTGGAQLSAASAPAAGPAPSVARAAAPARGLEAAMPQPPAAAVGRLRPMPETRTAEEKSYQADPEHKFDDKWWKGSVKECAKRASLGKLGQMRAQMAAINKQVEPPAAPPLSPLTRPAARAAPDVDEHQARVDREKAYLLQAALAFAKPAAAPTKTPAAVAPRAPPAAVAARAPPAAVAPPAAAPKAPVALRVAPAAVALPTAAPAKVVAPAPPAPGTASSAPSSDADADLLRLLAKYKLQDYEKLIVDLAHSVEDLAVMTDEDVADLAIPKVPKRRLKNAIDEARR
ncbi:hypothetical protein M885DRAFT_589407 [Pelagophyceae sp. CCMP2097]|nr:hypothetical protein M885DRAFT_589407 [Pelagophyceae sp. CCMP2097]